LFVWLYFLLIEDTFVQDVPNAQLLGSQFVQGLFGHGGNGLVDKNYFLIAPALLSFNCYV
jgi:hypothetical protein